MPAATPPGPSTPDTAGVESPLQKAGPTTPDGTPTGGGAGCETPLSPTPTIGLRWTDPSFKNLVQAWSDEARLRKQRLEKMEAMSSSYDDSIATLKHLLSDFERRRKDWSEARDDASESSSRSVSEASSEGRSGARHAKLKRMDSIGYHKKRLMRPRSAASPALLPSNDGKKHMRFNLRRNQYIAADRNDCKTLPYRSGRHKCKTCEAVYTERRHLLRHMKYCQHAHEAADMALPNALQTFRIQLPEHVTPAQIEDRQDEWEEDFNLFFDFEGPRDRELEVVGDKLDVAKLVVAMKSVPPTVKDMETFHVTFDKKPFGIYTVPGIQDRGIIVEDVPLPCGKHAYDNGVRRNMLVCEINGRNIEETPFDEAMQILKTAPLPVILSFRRDLGPLVIDSCSSTSSPTQGFLPEE